MDITIGIIGVAMSLAAALAYRAGKRRGPVNHARELKKLGAVLGLPRRRRETDDEYAARLIEHMQETEHHHG